MRPDAAAVLVVEAEAEVGLVVQAVEALHHRLLHFLDRIHGLARLGIDLEDALIVQLHFEVLGPAAVAAKPAPYLGGALHHDDSIGPRPRRADQGWRHHSASVATNTKRWISRRMMALPPYAAFTRPSGSSSAAH